MTCWHLLEIQPTVDSKKIKSAYANLLLRYHPEDDPAGFQELRKAFEEALEQSRLLDRDICPDNEDRPDSKTRKATCRFSPEPAVPAISDPFEASGNEKASDPGTEKTPESIIQAYMRQVTAQYANFSERVKASRWEALFNETLLWPIDIKVLLGYHLFHFFSENPWVPPAIYRLCDQYFSWRNLESELYENFSEETVDNMLWRINNCRWSLKYDDIPLLPNVDYDTYLAHRQSVARALIEGDLEKAGIELKTASAMVKGDSDLQRLAIVTKLLTEGRSSALLSSREMVHEHPDSLEGQLYHAHLLLKNGSITEAIHAFHRVLKSAPDHLAGLCGLAQCHLALDHLFEAQRLFEKALEQCPDHVAAHVDLLKVYHLQIKKLSPFIADDKADLRTLKRLAEAYYKADMLQQAEQVITTCLADSADSDTCLLWAHVLANRGQTDAAVEKFNQAQASARQNGENPYNVLLQRGIFHYNRDAFEPAVTDLEQVVTMRRSSIDGKVWYHLADAYQKIGANEKSIQLLDDLIDFDPTEPDNYHSRGCAYFSLNEYRKALKDFESELDRAYYSTARIWIVKCLVNLKDFEAASQMLDASEDFYSNDSEFYYYRAFVAYKQNDGAAACQQIQKSLDIDSDSGDSQFLAAFIYWEINEEGLALQYFDAFFHHPDGYPEKKLAVVRYCIAVNKFKKAIAYMEALLQLDSNPDLLLILAELFLITGHLKSALKYIHLYFSKYDGQEDKIDSIAYFLRGKIKYFCCRLRFTTPLIDLHKACDEEVCNMAFFFLSLVYFDLREYEKAEKFALAALSREPSNPDFKKLTDGIKRVQKFGWFRKSLISSRAYNLWTPTIAEPMYTLDKFPGRY